MPILDDNNPGHHPLLLLYLIKKDEKKKENPFSKAKQERMEPLYGFALACMEGVADAALKNAATLKYGGAASWPVWMGVGIAGYNALATAFYFFVKRGLLWKVNSYWDLTSHIVDLVIAFVVFGEKATMKEMVGLVTAIVGMVIMSC
jgi:uncharacterized membrane protein